MRVFLISCLAVAVIAVGSWFVLEKGLAQNAGDRFAISRSVRITDDAKPDPRGLLSYPLKPAGGITSGRTPGPDAPAPRQPDRS
jgi:hypothetical protein